MNLTKRASLPSFLGLLCLGIIPNLRNRKRLGRQVYGGAVASVSFISDCLEQAPIRLRETCEDLTQEEVLCRLALLQQCRSHPLACDTGRGQSDTPTGKRVYVVGGWHEKFGQPVDAPDPADRMSLRVLAIPDLTVLLGYSQAVGERIRRLLGDLTADNLDQPICPSRPEQSVAGNLRHLIRHMNNHHGQVTYIHGLQNQNWDLPPGTGAVLP